MNKEDLRIVYLGTPDFAVESLRDLVEKGYNVVGVVTMPDKPIGRHQNHLQPSPIKIYAESVGLPILQPVKLKDADFLEQLKALNADLQIVVAFRMLPEVVWAMPKFGTFNLHAALLPQYRGAAPINWAIINGEKETGITTFFLTHDIDTGDIIDRVTVPIQPEDDFGTIHDKLSTLGSALVTKTVDSLLNGTLESKPQSEFPVSGNLKPAPKIFRETCRIDWTAPAEAIINLIRGLSPVPTAWTTTMIGNCEKNVKIFKATKYDELSQLPAGTVESNGKDLLLVHTGKGVIQILELQMEGKKKMATSDFLRGHNDTANLHFA